MVEAIESLAVDPADARRWGLLWLRLLSHWHLTLRSLSQSILQVAREKRCPTKSIAAPTAFKALGMWLPR